MIDGNQLIHSDILTTGKLCIICREYKTSFNEEHVFPATIGGKFIIKTVCKECNSELGKNIDTPFSNHELILIYRNKLGLDRQGRSIKNPIKPQVTEDGRKFIVEQTQSGYKALFPPQFQEKAIDGRLIIVGSMSSEFVECPVATLNRYLTKFEKEYGAPIVGYDIERKRESELTAKVMTKDVKLIWEFLKISYEAAVTIIPGYFGDPQAVLYSEMLHNFELNKDILDFLNPRDQTYMDIAEVVNNTSGLEYFTSWVILYQHPVHGLCSVIRTFDGYPYCIILSKQATYLDGRKIVLLNDAVKRSFQCAVIKSPVSYDFHFYADEMTEDHSEEVSHSAFNAETFRNANNTISLYNSHGECLVQSINTLIQAPFTTNEYDQLAQMPSFIMNFNKGHYIKSSSTGLFYQVASIQYNLC